MVEIKIDVDPLLNLTIVALSGVGVSQFYKT
jgi:hypothetical protein